MKPIARRGAAGAVTIDDIARRVGVSKSSVSRALNGVPGGVTRSIAEQVHRAADELGYVPNAIAASLKHQRTKTVGLVLPDLENPFFARVVVGIESEVSRAGYSLLLANTGHDREREVAATHMLLERQVDALVIASSGPGGEHLRLAVARGIHVVLVDSHPHDTTVDCVLADNRGGAAQATRHLVDLGHVHIGAVGAVESDSSSIERIEGLRETLAASGLELHERHCARGDFGLSSGYDGARSLLDSGDRPSALFVLNNLMTVGALRAIADLGLIIPDDISLIGFDDMDWYPIANPPITAVAQPAEAIGREAGKRLLRQVRSKRVVPPRTIRLATQLIVRASTAQPSWPRARRR
jgi:LacI family transcriptional regulator